MAHSNAAPLSDVFLRKFEAYATLFQVCTKSFCALLPCACHRRKRSEEGRRLPRHIWRYRVYLTGLVFPAHGTRFGAIHDVGAHESCRRHNLQTLLKSSG